MLARQIDTTISLLLVPIITYPETGIVHINFMLSGMLSRLASCVSPITSYKYSLPGFVFVPIKRRWSPPADLQKIAQEIEGTGKAAAISKGIKC
jgi:hypothetical protein